MGEIRSVTELGYIISEARLKEIKDEAYREGFEAGVSHTKQVYRNRMQGKEECQKKN